MENSFDLAYGRGGETNTLAHKVHPIMSSHYVPFAPVTISASIRYMLTDVVGWLQLLKTMCANATRGNESILLTHRPSVNLAYLQVRVVYCECMHWTASSPENSSSGENV